MVNCPTAALVIIGQELLSGKVKDENVGYLTQQLYALGVEVKRVLFVCDDEGDIVEALRWVVDRHDHVFTTGGMGPTHDDVTVAAVAQALDRRLVHSPSLERLLETLYGLQSGPERFRLSRIPEGAELFYPEGARYPQLIVGNVFLFPGVPAIVRSKFEALADRFRGTPIFTEFLDLDRTELEILAPLTAVVETYPRVRFGSYPRYEGGKETVRLTLDATDEAHVREALELLQRLLKV
ncbi:competence/damage-inducible protein A [bacterium]|nr:competence/damage-inducible protein A [bacterium]